MAEIDLPKYLEKSAILVYNIPMDQIQALEILEESNFSQTQAKALMKVLVDLEDRAITKADLRVMKAELIIHIYSASGIAVAILSFIKFFS